MQLKQRDLPPVCAMTGAPAEVWGRFRFVTSPAWVVALHLLAITGVGLIPVLILSAALSRRASGRLPLTRSSRWKLRAVSWTSTTLFIAGIAVGMWGLGAVLLAPSIVGPEVQAGIRLIGAGVVCFALGWFGLFVIKRNVGPQGHVMDRWARTLGYVVELRNVHPAFVFAVHQLQREHVALHAEHSQSPRMEVN